MNFAKELDDYIDTVGKIAEDITPQKAGCIQAAINLLKKFLAYNIQSFLAC